MVGAVIAVIGAMAVIFGLDLLKMTVSTQDYDIFVDPIIDKQSLFITGRITVQNTGSQPLTNVRVNFGEGDVLELGSLSPGKKIILSPPPDNGMEFVQVTADNGVFVSKGYRELPKMVGMMGS
ncbi:MAG: hypothetical protein F4Y18_01475 [Cenarchaeum sp. SB0663_bin_5]|nr:hypothetical protein [Cenarchaeum sp. SB0663_bin_5]MYH04699.1 hypothetical protein [Cenarchaeum sp. SB0675_bin_21]